MRDIKKTKDIEEKFIKETKLTKEHKKVNYYFKWHEYICIYPYSYKIIDNSSYHK